MTISKMSDSFILVFGNTKVITTIKVKWEIKLF